MPDDPPNSTDASKRTSELCNLHSSNEASLEIKLRREMRRAQIVPNSRSTCNPFVLSKPHKRAVCYCPARWCCPCARSQASSTADGLGFPSEVIPDRRQTLWQRDGTGMYLCSPWGQEHISGTNLAVTVRQLYKALHNKHQNLQKVWFFHKKLTPPSRA